jgi:hypothetical protein
MRILLLRNVVMTVADANEKNQYCSFGAKNSCIISQLYFSFFQAISDTMLCREQNWMFANFQ